MNRPGLVFACSLVLTSACFGEDDDAEGGADNGSGSDSTGMSTSTTVGTTAGTSTSTSASTTVGDSTGDSTADGTSSVGTGDSTGMDGSTGVDGSTGGSSGGDDSTGGVCEPITEDGSAWEQMCIDDGDCPDGYTCFDGGGFQADPRCRILCTDSCECPTGDWTCASHMGKVGEWFQCDPL